MAESVGKSYVMGDVGAGATAIQGENIHVSIGALQSLPEGETLAQQFEGLMKQVAESEDLDEDSRELALEKMQAVAQGLAEAEAEPAKLRRSLKDAQLTLGTVASTALEGLMNILKSDAAQQTIARIADAGARAAVMSLTGRM